MAALARQSCTCWASADRASATAARARATPAEAAAASLAATAAPLSARISDSRGSMPRSTSGRISDSSLCAASLAERRAWWFAVASATARSAQSAVRSVVMPASPPPRAAG